MCGGSGKKAGGGGGSLGGGGNEMTEAQRVHAFIEKSRAEREANEAKKAKPTRYERMRGGSSVHDDTGSGGRRDISSDFAKRMRNPKFR